MNVRFKPRTLSFALTLMLIMMPWAQISVAQVRLAALNSEQTAWIGERIFQNETGGKRENLTFWSEAEEFPSFGLGHFIWIPSTVKVPFEATFVAMVNHVSQTHPAPEWAQQAYAPWASKKEFDQAINSSEMIALRDWLDTTKPQQTEFIIQRFQQRMDKLSSQLSNNSAPSLYPKNAQNLMQILHRLMRSPQGLFAVIDYVNFKGIGDNSQERYQHQGWGLLQVLQAMPADVTANTSDHELVAAFSQAAIATLQRRIELAPPQRNEARWMAGWQARVQGYLKD